MKLRQFEDFINEADYWVLNHNDCLCRALLMAAGAKRDMPLMLDNSTVRRLFFADMRPIVAGVFWFPYGNQDPAEQINRSNLLRVFEQHCIANKLYKEF